MIRVATFNVENLFSRPRVLNMQDNEKAASILSQINKLVKFLELESYASKKQEIESLYQKVREYISINIRSSTNSMGRFLFVHDKLKAKGRADWDGFVDLKRERFSEQQIKFTGKVISTVKADIQCLIEVESAGTLKRFNTDILRSRYSDRIVIDGNDPRGIDIALASRRDFPIVSAKTNIFARSGDKLIFSRDCLEVEIAITNTKKLHVLVNHFKAKDRNPIESDAKRKMQAEEVSRILRTRYDLTRDFVVVAGDLNDEPNSVPLKPLLDTPKLHNVLDIVGLALTDRWTYYFSQNSQYNTIDYMFVSEALSPHVKAAGLERRGMFNLDKLTNGAQQPFAGITNWKLGASDHAAVWVDVDL